MFHSFHIHSQPIFFGPLASFNFFRNSASIPIHHSFPQIRHSMDSTSLNSITSTVPTSTLSTKIVNVENFENFSAEQKAVILNKSVNSLFSGSVIALPTDTLYGIAASVDNKSAINAIYEIKGRSSTKPLAICIGSLETLPLVGSSDHLSSSLLAQLLPGPYTIVLERSKQLPEYLNPEFTKVGVRIPENVFIQQVCSSFTKHTEDRSNTATHAIALTSANISNALSSISISDFQDLWPKLDLIFDAGKLPESRIGSTVVDLSNPEKVFHVLRQGTGFENLLKILEKDGWVKED